MKAADKRAIEPVREVTFNNAVYHRPLTEAETMAASNSDFGPHLPKAHYTQTAMGVKWASFKLEHNDDGTKPGLDVCLNLYKTDINDNSTWFLPASRTSTDSAYTQNGYAADGNQPPLDNNDLLIRFTNIFNNNSKAAGKGLVGSFSGNSSPLFGWVTSGSYTDKAIYTVTPFWAASKPIAVTGQANSVKFYDNGSSGNNSVGNGRYVTCVKAASIQ